MQIDSWVQVSGRAAGGYSTYCNQVSNEQNASVNASCTSPTLLKTVCQTSSMVWHAYTHANDVQRRAHLCG